MMEPWQLGIVFDQPSCLGSNRPGASLGPSFALFGRGIHGIGTVRPSAKFRMPVEPRSNGSYEAPLVGII